MSVAMGQVMRCRWTKVGGASREMRVPPATAGTCRRASRRTGGCPDRHPPRPGRSASPWRPRSGVHDAVDHAALGDIGTGAIRPFPSGEVARLKPQATGRILPFRNPLDLAVDVRDIRWMRCLDTISSDADSFEPSPGDRTAARHNRVQAGTLTIIATETEILCFIARSMA